MQYSLLGCAFIVEESSENYTWVTRGDKYLKEAVTAVLLDSHHCFCPWRVCEAIPKYLGHIVSKHPDFVDRFDECVHASGTVDEFESRWQDFVSRSNFQSKEWVSSIYEDRVDGCLHSCRVCFLVGYPRPSEKGASLLSLISLWKRHLHIRSLLNGERYKAYAIDRYLLEAEAENELDCKMPSLPSAALFEWQMSGIYTRAVYEKFQSEVSAAGSCNHERATTDDAGSVIFRMGDIDGARNFTVSWKEADCEISCSCRLFEYRGFLCRHTVLVLQSSGVHCVPDRYILKGWTRNAKSERPVSKQFGETIHKQVGRIDNLSKLAIKLGEEASLSKEAYKIAQQPLEEASTHCATVNTLAGGISSTFGIEGATSRVNNPRG